MLGSMFVGHLRDPDSRGFTGRFKSLEMHYRGCRQGLWVYTRAHAWRHIGVSSFLRLPALNSALWLTEGGSLPCNPLLPPLPLAPTPEWRRERSRVPRITDPRVLTRGRGPVRLLCLLSGVDPPARCMLDKHSGVRLRKRPLFLHTLGLLELNTQFMRTD